MRMPYLFILFHALMLTACVTSPSPEEMTRRAEQNQWELAHWGDRQVPHGDNGDPVTLTFKDGKVSGHAGCNSVLCWNRLWPREGGPEDIQGSHHAHGLRTLAHGV